MKKRVSTVGSQRRPSRMARRATALLHGLQKKIGVAEGGAAEEEPEGFDAEAGVEREGWLWKKGHERTNWKKRYFVISGPFAAYYATEAKTPPRLGMIALKDAKALALDKAGALGVAHASSRSKQRLGFVITHPERQDYILAACTAGGDGAAGAEEEQAAWLDAFSAASVRSAHSFDLAPHYEALGLGGSGLGGAAGGGGNGDALSDNALKKAYRKLALKNHPDKGGDKGVFQVRAVLHTRH